MEIKGEGKLEKRDADHIVFHCNSRDEIVNHLLDYEYKLLKQKGKNLDVNREAEILWGRIQLRDAPLIKNIHLKGELKTGSIWLDLKLLDCIKSKSIFNFTTADKFYWGEPNSVLSPLSFAIIYELSNYDKAIKCYRQLKEDLIDNLAEEDFELRHLINY